MLEARFTLNSPKPLPMPSSLPIVDMRKAGVDSRTQEKRITATTRQLESMIRLSEAHARMRFSERVELVDVHEAQRLIKSCPEGECGKWPSEMGDWPKAQAQF